MAPRRDLDETFRDANRRNPNAATAGRSRNQRRSAQANEDGDVLMGGYRIPTIISSKGAVQHKQDRYAPREANRGGGHKRFGGRWDGSRGEEGRILRSTPVDDRRERYGDHQGNPILIEDDYDHRTHHTSSRRDRHLRDYQKSVNSSRIRYERDRHVSNRNRASDNYGNHRTQTNYSNNEQRSSRGYYSHYNSSHSSSQYLTSNYRREQDSCHSAGHYGSYHGRTSGGNGSDRFRRGQDESRRYYDQGRSQGDYQWRVRVRDDWQGGKRSEMDLDGSFEDVMKGLATHAAKVLKNASRRDRSIVETAVWKAYGDSIASLGNRYNTNRAGNRTNEWVSARGINNHRADDSAYNGSVTNRSHPSAHSAAVRRGRALQEYRQANKHHERTWEDHFGAGSYSGSASYAGSVTGSSEANSRTASTQSIGHSSGGSSSRSIRGRSRSPGSDSTVTAHRIRQEVPRPRLPPVRPIPVYDQDPNDPSKFLNVPRPPRLEQWDIPSDCYNGAAWEVHRKSEIETGAIPPFYPDRWVSGQSFGNAARDAARKETPVTTQKNQEVLGRECYGILTPALTNSTRSRSVASQLVGGFGAIRLDSVPRSGCESEHGGSELSDDFDLYGPPNTQLEIFGNTGPESSQQAWSLANSSEQQMTRLSDSISDVDDGSTTPKQRCLSYEQFSSREGSVVSGTPAPYNQKSMGGNLGNPLLVDDYLSSRETTPSLCLADFIEYDSRKISSLLKIEGSQSNLIDLSSPPPSLNGTRSRTATPSYDFQLHPRPNRRDQSSSNKDLVPTGLCTSHILDDDWESSFGIAARDKGHALSGKGNKENPLFIEDDDDAPAKNTDGGGVMGEFQALSLRSDIGTDDDLDFMGVGWFLKQSPPQSS